MKTFIIAIILAFVSFRGIAIDKKIFPYERPSKAYYQADSIKLQVEHNNAYYQDVVKADSNITEPTIYIRTLQFMASKNIQQNYGYQEEGKLIFSTTQDLNINRVYVGDDNETVQEYSVQFAITLDLKKGHYRYTINNVVFFLPTENGNRRENLNDIYLKATNTDSRRVARDAKALITSFERYISALTDELYQAIEQKSIMYKSKF
ncbi:MAG: hypothetical protein JWQ63_2543 [Mucilaginibacter sp.]|jgi:hypothetical protein|nr:hypothetical protein [Mucilaginibacter sp.]